MTALSIQLGAQSLLNLGVSLGDIGTLVQHARTFGNWLRTKQNDEELFESMSEVYGEVLHRRGLVDTTLMMNRWTNQMHFYYQGHLVQQTAASSPTDEQSLGSFTWLMVTLVTALDTCLPQYGFLPLLVKVFVRILDRDDVISLTESLQIQLQTNIESWRSTGRIRGMGRPVAEAIRACRLRLVGEDVLPKLTEAESEELCEFLVWLMAGSTNHYQLVSATLFAVVNGMRSAGLQLVVGEGEVDFEGQLIIQYAGQKDSLLDLLRLLNVDKDYRGIPEDPPPPQISYPYGEPWKMIEAMPRPIDSKNTMEKFWTKGKKAASFVKLELECTRKGILHYIITDYDKCISRWPGNLSELAEMHFPVDSERLLRALNDLQMQFQTSHSDVNWLSKHLRFASFIPTFCLRLNFTDDQMDMFLCYQCLVFGYWYQLLDPLISTRHTKIDVYLSGLWGLKNTYLLKMIEGFSFVVRYGTLSDVKLNANPGATRDATIRLLGVMYAGIQAPRDSPMTPTQTGLLGLIGNISVVCMSLLHPTDDRTEIGKFVILTLPILDLLQERDAELWAGDGSGTTFRQAPQSEMRQLNKVRAKMTWSVHTKRCMSNGRPSGIVLAARCNGVFLGTFDPARADAVVVGSSDDSTAEEGLNDEPVTGYTVTESDFQKGFVLRPYEKDAIVLVQSQGKPIMRYAAAGFFCHETNVVIGGNSLSVDLNRLKQRISGVGSITDCTTGVIIG